MIQELSGVWLSGLYSLEDLMLMDNEITRVQEEIFITNKNITRLNLAGNPLNCDCEMSYLVSWLQDHDELKGDVESIKCATPSHLANAPLVLITERLECSNSTETEYYEYYSEPGSLPAISSSLVHLVHTQYNPDTDELDLSWDIKEVSRPFSCGQIHIFQDIESGVDLVSESSLLCEHQEILNTETLNTSINIQDLELDTDTPYIICISVLHQETVVPGCSGSLTISHHVEDKKTTSNLDSDLVFHPLVTPTSSLRMNANLSEENSIIVYLDTKLQEHTSTACSILTTVSTPGEQEIDHHVVDCSAQQDIFKNVPVRSVYRVCSVLKVGEETETEIKEGINSRECVLISPTRILYRDKSILPLLLTLVFLALGIACLTVLYLILKRAREDRRSEGFRSSPHPPLKLIFCCRKIADKLSRRDYSQHTFLQQADQWT
ncbi:uncharacterized protein LOC111706316 [Eurytemora carolleeae]|uniref:uncharacterized protein LOC111706316 n=1 Tax=Eurytemora carolleeae TaxID=1294199 RepID=UPI000C786B8C|nr:uncharacterized protein LOC111706316 [Eurytemora carolleeae]|eukprot:XP_023334926.1 uncharacterized protein LOC111706316 [Eurytemora affinis]